MRTSGALAVLAAAGVAAAGVAFDLHPRVRAEFQGRPLAHWLAVLDDGAQSPQRQWLATEALHQLGTNAIPELLAMLRAEDSFLKRQALDWGSMQNLVRVPLLSADKIRWRARLGLLAIGTPALIAAVPGLETILAQGRASGWLAAQCLAAAGRPGLPALQRAVASGNPTARLQALTALRHCASISGGGDVSSAASARTILLAEYCRKGA